LVVSHDLAFLRAVAQEFWVLRDGTLTVVHDWHEAKALACDKE